MNDFKLDVVEHVIAIGVYIWLNLKIRRFKKELDVLKRDADNFGEKLGTVRAKARLLNKQTERTKNEITTRTLHE